MAILTILTSGHDSFVNSCHAVRRGPIKLCSGSDDCTIKIWDPRMRGQATTLNNVYQVTSVSFDDTAEHVISGGIDNDIKVFIFTSILQSKHPITHILFVRFGIYEKTTFI